MKNAVSIFHAYTSLKVYVMKLIAEINQLVFFLSTYVQLKTCYPNVE